MQGKVEIRMDRLYSFEKLPENIRQVGEQPERGRVYFEDYVVTYMEEVFKNRPEKSIVVYLGKTGKGECAGYKFIYGAVELSFEFAGGKENFSAEKWDTLYDAMQKYFPGSQIMGWGAGVCMMTSTLLRRIEQVQKKHFQEREQICFIRDESEESQILYHYIEPQLQKMSGYTIYYGKNPQMQEFVLRGKKKESMEASYTDPVMRTVRETIKKNEERRQGKKTVFAAVILLFVLTGAGGIFLMQSSRKIDKLEQTLAVVSEKKESASPEILPTEESERTEEPPVTKEPPVTEEPRQTEEAQKTEEPQTSPEAEADKGNGGSPPLTKEPAEKKTVKTQKKKTDTAGSTKKTEKKASAPAYQSYLVQKGDTLSQIVWRQYHDLSKVPLVKARNHITDENKIKEGQRIILPVY